MADADRLDAAPLDIRRDIHRGVDILQDGGCRDVYVFGSVAEGRAGTHSDIDFAVRGCPPDQFYRLQGRLLMQLSRPAHLLDLDVDPELADFLARETVLIHVG